MSAINEGLAWHRHGDRWFAHPLVLTLLSICMLVLAVRVFIT